MNSRLSQFLSAENITQAQFAETIDVAKASVSHVLSGRNYPSYDFIKSVAEHYPSINLEWLITGKGKMYRNTDADPSASVPAREVESFPTLFDPNVDLMPVEQPSSPSPSPIEHQNVQNVRTRTVESAPSPARIQNTAPVRINKAVEKILVFYSDGTYQELK